MRLKTRVKDTTKLNIQSEEPKAQLIKVNIFDPDRLSDLNQVKDYKGKFKIKVYKIAVIAALMLMPLAVFASDISKENIIKFTNIERKNNATQIVVENDLLNKAAQDKAEDMLKKNYFEHFSPDGKTPWDFIVNNKYDYLYAGENLAMDFKTAEGVDSAWMKSGSHKKNILNPKYTDIGIGISQGNFNGHSTTLVVQMFGTPQKSSNYSTFVDNVSKLLGVNK